MRGSTQERSHSSAQSVTRASWNQTTYRILRGPTWERSLSNAQSYKELLNNWPLEGTWEDPHGREAIFKCIKCDKSFSTSSYLMTHETTQERRGASAQSVTSVFQDQVPWRSIRGPILPSIAVCVCVMLYVYYILEGALEDPHRR